MLYVILYVLCKPTPICFMQPYTCILYVILHLHVIYSPTLACYMQTYMLYETLHIICTISISINIRFPPFTDDHKRRLTYHSDGGGIQVFHPFMSIMRSALIPNVV